MASAYLLLGGNIGERKEYLNKAVYEIIWRLGSVGEQSSIYETEPWGLADQASFYNQVIKVSTGVTPHDLLNAVLWIEQVLGRKRQEKFGARTIDIDILLYDDLVIQDPGLTIPHPELVNRRFALTPLAEIAGDYIHPVYKKTISELLEECKDPLKVNKLTGVIH